MVVTDSRLSAVRYKLALDGYIAEKGYTDIRSLVAFSGEVLDPDIPGKKFTETNKGIRESELPAKFAELVRSALERLGLCSNDPICADHDPSLGGDERSLHGAACHACLLVPETSCEPEMSS